MGVEGHGGEAVNFTKQKAYADRLGGQTYRNGQLRGLALSKAAEVLGAIPWWDGETFPDGARPNREYRRILSKAARKARRDA